MEHDDEASDSNEHQSKRYQSVISIWLVSRRKLPRQPSRQEKMRIAIPSIVIDFAPLWIAREKGFFRDERIEAEITYIQGNIRGVQSLLAGEVQVGIAGSAGPISARAAGEEQSSWRYR